MNIYSFKPTYLYIKRHTATGKLYFGKTVKNPEKYKGSGIYWKRHLKTYGNEVETLWYCLFFDEQSIKETAIEFSKLWNIVESTDWLNLIEEDGIGNGMPAGHKKSKEHIQKISESLKGKTYPERQNIKRPKEVGEKISKTKLNKNKKYTEQEKINISIGTKRAMNNPIVKSKCSAPHILKWILTDPEGNEYHISNLRKFCTQNNLNKSNLVQVAKGRYRHSGGWKCRYDTN